jgi:hypothetical protein
MTNDKKTDTINQAQDLISQAISKLQTIDNKDTNNRIIPKLQILLNSKQDYSTKDISLDDIKNRINDDTYLS